jgi:hypothetical protein
MTYGVRPWGVFAILFVGLIAGWLAGLITGGRGMGIIGDIIVVVATNTLRTLYRLSHPLFHYKCPRWFFRDFAPVEVSTLYLKNRASR